MPYKDKARLVAYRSTPEYKARARAYQSAPEAKAKERARRSTPKYKAKQRAYCATPERKARERIRRVAREFHVSKETAALLLKLGEGKCFLCGRQWQPEQHRLHIDHEHKHGIIRGVVCVYCNRWLVKGGETALHQRPGLDLGVLSRYLRLELPIQAQLRSIQYTKQSCPNGAQE